MNNHREMPEVAWFPIQCRTRQENRTGEHLAHQGFECFNPRSRVEKLHARKVKQQEQPMFPGNPFAIIKTQNNWTALHTTRGIPSVVSFCGQLIPIDEGVAPSDYAAAQLGYQAITVSMTSMISRAHMLLRFESNGNRETGGRLNFRLPADEPAESRVLPLGGSACLPVRLTH